MKQEVKGENTSFLGNKLKRLKGKLVRRATKDESEEGGEEGGASQEDLDGNLEAVSKKYPSNGSVQNGVKATATTANNTSAAAKDNLKAGKES